MAAAAPATSVSHLDLGAIMQNEDMTNAVWNRILHDLFPGPQYIIAPEYYWFSKGGKTKGKADLAVLFSDSGKVLVAYEGKREGGGVVTMKGALDQAVGCISGTAAAPLGVAISALGEQFAMTDKDYNDLGKFKEEKGKLWIQTHLDEIVTYLAKVAEKGKYA